MLLSLEKTKEWFKDKPDNITAYKVVEIKDGKVFPSFFNEKSFKKTNKLKKRSISQRTQADICHSFYQPYYHFFLDRRDAKGWAWGCETVLECTVPKDQITVVGRQADSLAIVAKEFTFVEGDEYFTGE